MNILKELTKKYLMFNKKRTIVTIIAIVLAGSMISGVATLATSFQKFLINTEIEASGRWQAIFKDVKLADLKYIENNNKFDEVCITSKLYTAQNEYSDEEYLRIDQYDEKALDMLGEKLIEGRMPKNSNEIVLSSSFFDKKENEPKIGDTITLNVGDIEENQNTNNIKSENQQQIMKFKKTGTKTYKICGKIESPIFERNLENSTAGITLIDRSILNEKSDINVGITAKKVKNIYKDNEDLSKNLQSYTKDKIDYNDGVLMYMGVNNDTGFNTMLYSVCGVLIAIIVIGSVLVIYNSFAISVSERKKQFGMLSSIGATKKQIRQSVVFEGGVLGLIGIPLGILCGIAGIGITLKVVNNLLKPMIEQEVNGNLELVISYPTILIAVVLIAITIYLSVVIPARRASKITPIEAIRQTEDIKVKGKKLKTSRIIRKFFGVEGEIGLKNLKRSKKRYRATVISLVISIVLFISVSGFVEYMFTGFDSRYTTVEYDYCVNILSHENNKQQEENLINEVMNINDVQKLSYLESTSTVIDIPEIKITDKIKDTINNEKNNLKNLYDSNKKIYNIPVSLIALDDNSLESYSKEIGLDKLNKNQVILVNYLDLLKTYHIEGDATKYKVNDKLKINIGNDLKELPIAKTINKGPFGAESNYGELRLLIVMTKDTLKEINMLEKDNFFDKNIVIKSNNVSSIEKQINQIKQKYPSIDVYNFDIQKQMQMMKNLKLIIQIFLYGFIVLISLIGITNVFNTISTNIILRKREFANLKSIGMTEKQFRKMLDLECIFYGTKSLLYAIPISIFICYLINKGFSNMIVFSFNIPWQSIIISIVGVYVIVYSTMIYARKKVKKENIIDVLKNDNI